MRHKILLPILLFLITQVNAQRPTLGMGKVDYSQRGFTNIIDSNSRWTSKRTSDVHESFFRCYNTETIVDTGFPCTSILGTADNQEASKVVTLYPNPVQNILNIKSEFMFNTLSVYDNQGTKVLESKATVNLDVSALPEGLYLLEAWDLEGRRVLKKFEKR